MSSEILPLLPTNFFSPIVRPYLYSSYVGPLDYLKMYTMYHKTDTNNIIRCYSTGAWRIKAAALKERRRSRSSERADWTPYSSWATERARHFSLMSRNLSNAVAVFSLLRRVFGECCRGFLFLSFSRSRVRSADRMVVNHRVLVAIFFVEEVVEQLLFG